MSHDLPQPWQQYLKVWEDIPLTTVRILFSTYRQCLRTVLNP